MTNSRKTQLGYFINFDLWQDALDLLGFQVQQRDKNKHFNTLSMFYYGKLNTSCLTDNDSKRKYFDTKIRSSLFYGLKKEFAVFPYVIPKPGLGLRDYKFFTYPMRVVYYTVGLYLLKLSQEFLTETYKKIENISSFYGGNLHYKDGKLQLKSQNIYYRNFHEEFKSKIKEEIDSNDQNKIMLKLDIENYFNELSIPILLQLLDSYIKPSTRENLTYDLFTKEQINCLFQFISNGKPGIPQSDNSIMSGFIGYLYLVFGDLLIDNILVDNREFIDSYKIIRYVDDLYISITFKSDFDSKFQGSLTHSISAQIAEVLYTKLSLKLNLKTRLYRLAKEEEREELLQKIRKISPSNEYFISTNKDNDEDDEHLESEATIDTPQEKLNKIFKELRKIKKSRVEDYLMRDDSTREEILQEIFDKRVGQILDKPENKAKIKRIFKNFDFDLVKVQPLEILIIILRDEMSTANFKKFCLRKTVITTGDADLILKFLCQTNFEDQELLKKLKLNCHMHKIIDSFVTAKLHCDRPGYYSLNCMQIKQLAEMPEVIEQVRLRVLSERSLSYSVALNHLVNEIHAICIKQDQKKKDYTVKDVVEFLRSKHVQHEVCIKIRNLFDRRNSNSVSHPSSYESLAWEVTKEEYLDYYENVGTCLALLL